jgi:RNA polymerase sigma-70 factor, ECF subfamily
MAKTHDTIPAEPEDLLRLAARARCGDATAWGRLVPRIRSCLRDIAARWRSHRSGGAEDASDIAQKALRAVWMHLDQFRGGTEPEFWGWLRRIVIRECLQADRRSPGPGRMVPLPEDGGDLLAADTTSPSGRAARDDEKARLRQALQRLPEAYREVLVLKDIQGLPWEEIERQLGLGREALKKRRARALLKIKGHLEDHP